MLIGLLSLNLSISVILWSGVSFERTAPQPSYYDTRERVAAVMSFEWAHSLQVRYSVERIRELNDFVTRYVLDLAERANDTSQGIVPSEETIPIEDVLSKVLIDESISNMVFDLSYHYTIKRASDRTYVYIQEQGIDLDDAKVVDVPAKESYLQNDLVIEIYRDTTNGQISGVHIAQADTDVLGLGSPFGALTPELLVVYAGVSPFRLYGRKPEDWRLVSVSPEEWVFELPRESGDNSSFQAPHIRFHLDRRYQDALSRLEVRYEDGTIYTWRVLKYRRIGSVWFPAEVEWIVKGDEAIQSKAILLSARPTDLPLKLEIPKDTRVTDYRRCGSEVWTGIWDEDKVQSTKWGEEFEKLLQPSSPPLRQRSKEPPASSNPKR